MDFLKYFSDRKLVPRPQQIEVLKTLEENWDKYKYFGISAPPGVGKTHIALAIAEEQKQTYLLTVTKQLQEQYEKTSAKIVNLKGRGNYVCNVNHNFSVDAAPCAASQKLFASCRQNRLCDYYNQKDKALASQMMITNYAFFLYSTLCGVVSDLEENPWKRRPVIVFDEAHELESHLISFGETKLKLSELLENYGIGNKEWEFTNDPEDNAKLIELIYNGCVAKIGRMKEQMKDILEDGSWLNRGKAGDIPQAVAEKIKKINSKLYVLDKIYKRLEIYIKTKKNNSNIWIDTPNLEDNSIIMSPLYANFLFHEYLGEIADKFVFMSATMPPKKVFCEEHGLPEEETLFIEVGTPFLPAKSPIVILPVAKLGYKDIEAGMPYVVQAVEAILDEHKNEKGLIHTGNYRIAKDILSMIDKEHRGRLISRDMHGDQKVHNQDMMKLHLNDEMPTVLLSPSMTTGIDLFDDLARFQIIVKLPFLSLGDARIKKKSSISNDWYMAQMWLQVMQASCRATRNEEDHSTTYVLDASFEYFFDKSKKDLPGWFKERINA